MSPQGGQSTLVSNSLVDNNLVNDSVGDEVIEVFVTTGTTSSAALRHSSRVLEDVEIQPTQSPQATVSAIRAVAQQLARTQLTPHG